jgi:phospholipid N-methyltransferase
MTASGAGTAAGKSREARRRTGPLRMFAKGFVKHPVMVGSIIPSSRFLIDKMLKPVDWRRADVFVEYGPGVGTITTHILERLKPDAVLIAFDTNPDFCDYLANLITDSRLRVVNRSAADVADVLAELGLDGADYVISGLPFSTLPAGVGPAIARATQQVLRAGGQFLVYQFSPKVLDFLKLAFQRIDRGFELINVPPAQLFWAHKD